MEDISCGNASRREVIPTPFWLTSTMVMADCIPHCCSLFTAMQDDKKTFGVVRRELLERSGKIGGALL